MVDVVGIAVVDVAREPDIRVIVVEEVFDLLA